MGSSKNDIDKIDEQIKNIMDEEKEAYKEKDDPTHEVIIDRKYDYDDVESTKKIDKIEDIDSDDDIESTKRLDNVSDVVDNNDDSLNKEDDNDKNLDEEDISVKDLDDKTEEKIDEDFSDVKKKPNIGLIIGIIVGVIVLIILILFLVLGKSNKTTKDESDNNKKLSKNEQEEIINKYGDALKGAVSMYIEKQNIVLEYDDAIKLVNYDEYDVKCSEHEIYKDGNIYLNNCKIDDLKTSYSYGEKQEEKEEEVVVDDDGIKVYVSKKNNSSTFSEPKNKDDYDVYSFHIEGKYSDLTLLNEEDSEYVFYYDENNNVQMINFKKDKKALSPLNYTSILPIKYDDMYDNDIVAVEINDKWGIYSLKTRERIVSHKFNSVAVNLNIGISGPPLYIDALEKGKIAVCIDGDYGIIDYTNGNEVVSVIYSGLYKSGTYLFARDEEDNGHIFDYSGKEYLKDNYDAIYGIIDGKYILVNDKEDILIVKPNGKVYYNYGKIDFRKYNFGMSYNNGALFQLYQGDDYDKCIEVLYDPESKEGETKEIECGGIAKPILYLYPKVETNLSINFEHPEYLETTYPKFNGKWSVRAKSNGDLYDKAGNYYYALYWDEKKVHTVDFSTGFYVEDKDAIDFLEQKLDYIGLSAKERNEFIMYWLPVLEKNGKSLVYFELTEERESYNRINIIPRPDSLLRVIIHIKKVDKKQDIAKESLSKFQRKGFVAVEWGGTTY